MVVSMKASQFALQFKSERLPKAKVELLQNTQMMMIEVDE